LVPARHGLRTARTHARFAEQKCMKSLPDRRNACLLNRREKEQRVPPR
jgi:hypothetical protein